MNRRTWKTVLCLVILCLAFGSVTTFASSDDTRKSSIQLTYSLKGTSKGEPVIFLLKGVTDDTPMPSDDNPVEISVAPNTTGSFGTIVYDSPGIYSYEVSRKETSSKQDKWDYSVYQVTIVARSNGEVQQVIEKDGEKVMKISYEDQTPAEKDVIEKVQTGDLQSLILPGIGLLISFVGLVGLLITRRRERQCLDCEEPEEEKLEDEVEMRKSKLSKQNASETAKTILEEERKPLSEYWKYMGIFLAAIICVSGFTVPSSAATKDLTVTYDQYEELPENYVRIKGLPLHEAEISMTNSNIHKYNGYVGNNQTTKRDFIAYYGTVKFGSKNRTSTENATMTANNINGEIVLLWKNRAILSDNTKADVKIVVSGWTFYLGKNTNSKITSSTKVYVPILQASSSQSNATELCSSSPRTSYSTASGTTSNTLSGASIKTHCNVKIEVLKAGTDEPIDAEKYPRMLFGFRDLDVADYTIASGKSTAVRYNGAYAEGVELIDGFESPICLAKKTSTNPAMQTLEKVTFVNNNLRISGDGNKFEAYNQLTDYLGDNGSYYSGFISPVQPQGFNFKWTGSMATTGNMLGTALWNQPEVAVRATAGEGGTIQKEGTTTYIINSSTTYDYTASPGYRVKALTVEGEAVDFDETGGTYKFKKLYTSPATPRSSKTGEVTSTKVYTIDVQFERIEYQITTKVTNGSIDPSATVGEGDDKIITYQPDDGYELEKITVDGKDVDPKDYSKEYDFRDVHDNHEIEVVYSRIPVSDLTIRKVVTGALGDRSKKFDFEVKLSNLKALKEYEAEGIDSVENGAMTEVGFEADKDGKATLYLKLKADESAKIPSLPRGTIYQVKEKPSDHIASYEQTGEGDEAKFVATSKENADANKTISTEEEVVDAEDGNIEIVVTNNRPIATVTGVGTDDTPYLLAGIILAVLSGGWIIYVIKYRRKYD